MALVLISVLVLILVASFAAWRRYLWATEAEQQDRRQSGDNSLTEVFGPDHLINVPHQSGSRWLTEIFSRSAQKYPDFTALQIPHTGESLSFAELDARAESVAAALSAFLSGPDQVVAVAMPQDNWQIVASHLGIMKAGGVAVFLDSTLPEAQTTHILKDAEPVVVLTRGQEEFRVYPTLDVLQLPDSAGPTLPPTWLDDPSQRLATIFYTSGTTGMPKGVECPHGGYVNLALSYADYFDLVPGMDATTLTSSLGYDGSISEMYSAWVSGCAVVMLTKEETRSGPDLLPVLRDAEVTVLFCPPVLLTTLTATPELDLPYPLCRYIVPAGETFPDALVEPWTRCRRQIINTYGPTEASTDTSRQSLRPGEPVTIGSPLPNVTYAILEIDRLRALPHGEVGELCIGGVHVARGYRNLPDQTARSFISHPEFGRLYRTGDKCMIDGRTKRVHFLGRIDAQLKVRGHRVEPQAIEDILQSQFSEIEAAVLDYQGEALVAFVAAPSISTSEISGVESAPRAWAERVTGTLAKQLAPPSVPSRIFLVDNFAMKSVSGKIDRSRLPDLSELVAGATEEAEKSSPSPGNGRTEGAADAGNETSGESPACQQVLQICKSVFEAPIGLDDGFVESGGHSITIARLAQKLQAAGWTVPVRALLSDYNTPRKVAERQQQIQPARTIDGAPTPAQLNASSGDEAAAELLPVDKFTGLQMLFSLLLYSPGLIAFLAALSLLEIGQFFATASLMEFIAVSFVLYLASLVLPFVALLWVMAIKHFLGGHIYRNGLSPGAYPKWSKMHLRIWCIGQLENAVLFPLNAMFRSAPLTAFALRQLGATVGRNLQCARDADLAGPLDLLTIEDDVAIQTGAYIHTSRWSGQYLLVGPIRLESGCKIGMRAAVANDVTVGRGTWVTPFTPIMSDVGAQEVWEGAPARLTGHVTDLRRTWKFCRHSAPVWLLESVNVLMQIATACLFGVIPLAAIAWFLRPLMGGGELTSTYFQDTPISEIAVQLSLYTLASAWLVVVMTSLLGCLFIRLSAASPGLYSSHGLRGALLMYRLTMMNAIQNQWTWSLTGQYLRALAGLRFPRVGASECDVMFNLVPEVASADSRIFWSNGCFTNMLDYGARHLTLRQLDMPRNFFAGNNCVAESGHLPSNFLLGVSTPASDIGFRRQMSSQLGEPITVAGNPPVHFASASFEVENEAHKPPGFGIFLTRILLHDVFTIATLRILGGLVFALLFIWMLQLGVYAVIGVIAALVLTEASLILLCVATKKALVGRWGSDHSTPFWSWRHFSYFFAQDCFFIWCRGPLGLFAGTILANPILRWMGCEIGPRTIVTQPMQCSDWNAVSFGEDCVVGGFLQFHSFEDMTLKVKRTRVDDGSTVAFGTTVMGGAVIERDTTLLPLSMVLKEMNLLSGDYEGSPTEPTTAPGLPLPRSRRRAQETV